MPAQQIQLGRLHAGSEVRVITPGQDIDFILPSSSTDPSIHIGETFSIANRIGVQVNIVPDSGVTLISAYGSELKYKDDRIVIRKVEQDKYEVIDFSGNPLLSRLQDVVLTNIQPGDALVWGGTDWANYSLVQNLVTSVNGHTGAVILTTTDIAEGQNKYYTKARFDIDFSQDIATTKLTDLFDVDVPPSSLPGQVLTYDGNMWAPATLPGAPVLSVNGRIGTVILSSGDVAETTNLYFTTARFNQSFDTKIALTVLNDLADVTIGNPATDDLLVFSTTAGWKNESSVDIMTRAIGSALAGVLNNIPIDQLTDVDTTTVIPVQYDLLQYDGLNWVPIPPNSLFSNVSLGDLSDVDFTNPPAANDLLQFVDGAWSAIPVSNILGPGGYVQSINGLAGQVTITTTDIPQGTNLYFTQAAFDAAFGMSIAATKIDDLLDVDTNGVQDLYTLVYDGVTSNWKAVVPPSAPVFSVNGLIGTVVLQTGDIQEGIGGGISSNLYWTLDRFNTAFAGKSIDDLNDVLLTAPNPGEYLVFSGGKWINSSIVQGAVGPDTAIQFNSSGAFAGTATLTWTESTKAFVAGDMVIESKPGGALLLDSGMAGIGAPGIDTLRLANSSEAWTGGITISGANGITIKSQPLTAGAFGDGKDIILTATNGAAAPVPHAAAKGGSITLTIGRSSGEDPDPSYFTVKRSSTPSDSVFLMIDGIYGTWKVGAGTTGTVGTPGQVLTSNGDILPPTWANPAPLAAGTDTQIQYNSLGATVGSSKFTWTNTTSTLLIGNGGPAVIKQTDAGSFHNHLTIQAGQGGTYEGGDLTLVGGAAGTTTAAGAAYLMGGPGGSTAPGGKVRIEAGSATGSGVGGAIEIAAGNSGTGAGGAISLTTGNGSTKAPITLSAGQYISFLTGASHTTYFTINETGSFSIGANNTNFGNAGQVLSSNGLNAAPSWIDISAFAAVGPTGAVQYANSGALQGTASFLFDPLLCQLTLFTSGISSKILSGGTSQLEITSGNGAAFYLRGGAGTGGSVGGDVFIEGGSNAGSVGGGNVTISASDGTTGGAGSITLTTGASANAIAGTNGDLLIKFGGTGNGGNIVLKASTGSSYTEIVRITKTGAWSFGSTGVDTGTSGQVLMSNGSAAGPTWATVSALPSQSGNGGKYLTTDGANASWASVVASNIAGGAATQIPFQSAVGTTSFNAGLTFTAGTSTLLATNLAGSGTAITALNASNLGSGTVPTARLGTGTASATTYLKGDSTWSTLPYDVGMSYIGVAAAGNVSLFVASRTFTIPSGATGSIARAITGAAASTTFNIIKRSGTTNTTIGTVVFAAGGTSGTFTVSSATSFAIGDMLILNLVSADASLANVAFTFMTTNVG